MMQLRANNQRQQRSVARAASAPRPNGFALNVRPFGLGTDANATAWTSTITTAWTGMPASVWNVKPMHTTAICTFGKYHAQRLQEMPT